MIVKKKIEGFSLVWWEAFMVVDGWALVCAVGAFTFDFVEYDFA